MKLGCEGKWVFLRGLMKVMVMISDAVNDAEFSFLQRVKEYLVGSSLVSKLQAKHDLLRVAVEKGITSAFLT